MTPRFALPALVLVSALAGAGIATAYRAAGPDPVIACRTGASAMAKLELLFGMSRKSGGEVSDAEWAAFLDAEVTPRFPDGLTVLAGNGQWRNDAGVLTREKSRMLLIWYAATADSDGKIEAIRNAFKAGFGQESVMRVDNRSCVSFR
jgi:Protein of unknown function (DUF3574)